MVRQVIRAVEVPISISVGVAIKGAALAGRVTVWAVTGVVRELAPDGRQEGAAAPEVDERPVTEAATMVDERPADEATTDVGAEPAVGAETATAPVADEEAAAPPVGGAHEAALEHEPGIGTSVRARDPHSALNNPVTEADLTEWPDPYDHREDPRDPGDEMVFGGEAGHTQTGATSTSEPHPSQDPEAEPWEGPKRDKVDE